MKNNFESIQNTPKKQEKSLDDPEKALKEAEKDLSDFEKVCDLMDQDQCILLESYREKVAEAKKVVEELE